MNLTRWKGKVALVTGASTGIGFATAPGLAKAGMRVAVTARNGGRLEELKASLDGAAVLPVTADLQQEADIRKLFQRVREAWGGVDVLINNAGLGYLGQLSEQSPEDWRAMLDVNVMALSLCVQEALADMKSKPEGHIINISSIAGHRVPPSNANPWYAATKHAVRAITDALRIELVNAHRPVRVGMISPGVVETEFHDRATRGAGDSKAFYSTFKPLRAEDVADVVFYLLSTPPHVQIHDVVMRSIEQPF